MVSHCNSPGYNISIHAPHARSDVFILFPDMLIEYFNPRSSCEERPVFDVESLDSFMISIHAPHARSDSTSQPRRLQGI